MKGSVEISWMSWSECRETEVDGRTAVIWILNPEMKPFNRRAGHELTLHFWDRSDLPPGDHVVATLLGRWPDVCCTTRRLLFGDNGGWPWRPPLRRDADDIKAFVQGLPDDVCRVIVACEFGMSRSRAVAEWLAAKTGTVAVGNRTKGEPNGRLSDLLFGSD